MATSSGLFLATIYNQSQLAERKHYWSINTAATAVPSSAHPSPLVITTKLAAAILGGGFSEEVFSTAQYCPRGSAPTVSRKVNLPFLNRTHYSRLQRRDVLNRNLQFAVTSWCVESIFAVYDRDSYGQG